MWSQGCTWAPWESEQKGAGGRGAPLRSCSAGLAGSCPPYPTPHRGLLSRQIKHFINCILNTCFKLVKKKKEREGGRKKGRNKERQRQTPQSSPLPLQLCEVTAKKKQPSLNCVLTKHLICKHLDYGLLNLQNCEKKKILLFIRCSLWYFVTEAQQAKTPRMGGIHQYFLLGILKEEGKRSHMTWFLANEMWAEVKSVTSTLRTCMWFT